MIVYLHPTCSTCKRALQQLDTYGYQYETRDIREDTPPRQILEAAITTLPIGHVVNTSGELYRSGGWKARWPLLSTAEQVAALADNGMLIKRPVIIDGDRFTFGAKPAQLAEYWEKRGKD